MRLVPLLLVLATGAAAAAEPAAATGSGHSLRLVLQGLPTDYETETTVDFGVFSGAGEGEGEWEDAGRLSLGYRWTPDRAAPVAFGLGIGLAFSAWADEDGLETETGGVGVWIEPGIIWRPLRWLEFEGGLHVGGGSVATESEGGFDYETATYGEFGLDLRAIAIIRDRLELFLALGWLTQSAEVDWENESLGVTGSTEFTTSGGWGGIGFGVRL